MGMLVWGGVGCELNLGEAPFLCSNAGQCPDDYECIFQKTTPPGYCVKYNTCPDALAGCAPHDAGPKEPDARVDTKKPPPSDGPLKDKPVVPPKDKGDPSCVPGATTCADSNTLRFCDNNGTWKTASCATQCKLGGFDYGDTCSYQATKAKHECDCFKYVGFGGLCTKAAQCPPATPLCAGFGSSAAGFCTVQCYNYQGVCPTSGPAGSLARCLHPLQTTSGTIFVCGFDCSLANCPSGLSCDYIQGYCRPP